jgi:hypothetical protein
MAIENFQNHFNFCILNFEFRFLTKFRQKKKKTKKAARVQQDNYFIFFQTESLG